MSVWKIRLLGGLNIACDDMPLPTISSTVSRSLLAYLLTYRQQSHTRNLLAGMFWPDLPDAVARRRLSQALWQMNKAFAPDPIVITQGDAVQINPQASIWLDLAAFEQQSANHSEPALLEAVACYQGDFMAGYYDDWLLVERERLRDIFLSLLERLVTASKARGAYATALAYALRLVKEDPWREEIHCEVMRLYHLMGRHMEALKQYQVCQRVLADELGIPPTPETQALVQEIASRAGLDNMPWLPAAVRPQQGALLERPDRLPLVGRQAELTELLNQVDAATQGEGGLTIIYGEAGIGKTRLLQELERNIHWRGLSCAWGYCSEAGGSPAYQPLIEVLRAHLPALRQAPLEPLWRAELARLLPELEGEQPPAPLDPEQEQRRLLEAFTLGFAALANTFPCLVLLEDAHWMDPASLAVLCYLLPRLNSMKLRIVLTARSEELLGAQANALSALENTRLPRRIHLERLNLDETGKLVQHALDMEVPPQRFTARLFTETEGNPFFVTETLRTLVEENLLYRDPQGKWSTTLDKSTQDYSELPLPDSVVHSIERRLARLPAQLHESLCLAAVIGRQVRFELWLHAGDLKEQDLLAAGDTLCSRGLLITPPALETEIDYIFAHDQIRRVTYAQLSPPRRRFYHRQVAQALASLSPNMLAVQAYHWTEAQVWDRAADCHQQAGEHAAAVYANASAVEHYTRALDALAQAPGPPDLQRQFALRLAREQAYDLQGARQQQSQELADLTRLVETLDDGGLLAAERKATVALRYARQAAFTSDYQTAIAAASLAAQLARDVQTVTIEASSLWELGWALLLQGEHAAANAEFRHSLALARSANMRSLEADALHGLGTVCLVTCEYAQAKLYFHQVLEISRQVDIQQRVGRSLSNLGYIAVAQGDPAASKAYNKQALHIYREIGDQKGVATALEQLGNHFLSVGDFGSAQSYLEAALAIQQDIQAHENSGVTLRSIGSLFHQLGDYEQAREYYQQALQIFEHSGVRWYLGLTWASLSLLSHHLGDDETARQQSQRGLKIASEIGDRLSQGWLLDALGHALTGLGNLDGAAAAYRHSLTTRQALEQVPIIAESLAGLARVALARGQINQALEYVQSILQIENSRGLDGTNEPLRIYWSCYQVLEASHDPKAGDVLAAAHEHWQKKYAHIPEASLQRLFRENVVASREIIAAYREKQDRGQKYEVSLPRIGALIHRPLSNDELVNITWTVSAPEDEAIIGKAARRQHRLVRLLRQAHDQGAAPAHQDLAKALQVSLRTVERDIAALTRAGVEIPPTRGKMSV